MSKTISFVLTLTLLLNFSSQDGSGIWVVKSRAAAAPGSTEIQNAQQHPKKMHKIQMSNVCGMIIFSSYF